MLKRDSWLIRIVWLICFVASTVVCVYLITTGIMSYFDFETATKTEKIQLVSTSFPAVTICNTNSFLTNTSVEFVETLFEQSDLDFELNNLNARDLMVLRYFAGTNALDPNRTDAFRRMLSPSLPDIVYSCTFNLHPCSLDDDFSWYFDNFYGNCFTFNSGKE